MSAVSHNALFASLANFFALGCGLGLVKKAPGTFGTLLGIPLLLCMPDNAWLYLLVVVLLFLFGIWCCGSCANHLGVHDHGAIVWDEVVGFLITMFLLPVSIGWIIAGFVVFRFFDIIKPWPISVLDKRVHGGFGIMVDDALAGLFALVTLHVIHRLL